MYIPQLWSPVEASLANASFFNTLHTQGKKRTREYKTKSTSKKKQDFFRISRKIIGQNSADLISGPVPLTDNCIMPSPATLYAIKNFRLNNFILQVLYSRILIHSNRRN